MTFVLGHAASGKSAFAEAEALDAATGAGIRPTYVATARILDDEMRAKVADHVARRGEAWTILDASMDLAGACRDADGVVLIDCATMWLTNAILDGRDWEDGLSTWIDTMKAKGGTQFWVVSNDVGGGVVPDNALARRFQRAQGAVNMALAAAAGRVALVTAGLPQWLK